MGTCKRKPLLLKQKARYILPGLFLCPFIPSILPVEGFLLPRHTIARVRHKNAYMERIERCTPISYYRHTLETPQNAHIGIFVPIPIQDYTLAIKTAVRGLHGDMRRIIRRFGSGKEKAPPQPHWLSECFCYSRPIVGSNSRLSRRVVPCTSVQ